MSFSAENNGPEILEKIDIPVPTLIFGESSDKIILLQTTPQKGFKICIQGNNISLTIIILILPLFHLRKVYV